MNYEQYMTIADTFPALKYNCEICRQRRKALEEKTNAVSRTWKVMEN